MKNPDLISLENVLSGKLCISCGLCAHANSPSTKLDMRGGMFIPDVDSLSTSSNLATISKSCPGKGYELNRNHYNSLAGTVIRNNHPDLGGYQDLFAARSIDADILKKASSGGVMTIVARYLLEKNIVQGVLVTEMVKSTLGPVPSSYIAKNATDLYRAQGSKYCPVPSLAIDELRTFEGKLAVIGTPCQVAAIVNARELGMAWPQKVKITLANFCGGFRDLRETWKIIERQEIKPADVKEISYRGGGAPGFMTIKSSAEIKVNLPYPDYVRYTGLTKHRRCRLCEDATGELADISFGDAWLDRFSGRENAWSLVIPRSKFGEELVGELIEQKLLMVESVSPEEVVQSQIGNVSSKKHRQAARRFLYRLLGINLPNFGTAYKTPNIKKILLELKIVVSHMLLRLLESVGLYVYFAKLFKRYPEK